MNYEEITTLTSNSVFSSNAMNSRDFQTSNNVFNLIYSSSDVILF